MHKSRVAKSVKPINDVLAANLKHFMQLRGFTQASLGKKAGIGQTTVGLYLSPERREPSASGKIPSATLSQVAQLAEALSVAPWELLRDMTPTEREFYRLFEEAFMRFAATAQDSSAPLSVSESIRLLEQGDPTGHQSRKPTALPAPESGEKPAPNPDCS